MAEKKVGSKNQNNSEELNKKRKRFTAKRDADYDDFIAKHSQDLRRRSTVVVNPPDEKKPAMRLDEADSSRCGEIDPHTTENPALIHNIMTKRNAVILSDDSGFKADSYNDRFKLEQELTQSDESEVSEEQLLPNLPGQQTMADFFSEGDESVGVPVESNIDASDDAFANAYRQMRESYPAMGKGEKLRAIARTAAEDTNTEAENQLSFPVFDASYKKSKKRIAKKALDSTETEEKPKKKKNKPLKGKEEKQEVFDIDQKELVTKYDPVHSEESDNIDTLKDKDKSHKRSNFFNIISSQGEALELTPDFEIKSKAEADDAIKKIKKNSHQNLIRTAALLILGIITLITSLVFDNSEASVLRVDPPIFITMSIIFVLLGGAICIKELIDGAKDMLRLRPSLNATAFTIYISVLIQNIFAAAAKDTIGGTISVFSPVAIFLLISVTLPNVFLSNNTLLAINSIKGSDSVKVLRKAADAGMDKTLNDKYAPTGTLRYPSSASFLSSLISRLTNAIPKLYGARLTYFITIVFAIIIGISSSVIKKSAVFGATAFSAVIIAGLQISYTAMAAFVLLNANTSLSKKKSSLISYRCAADMLKTKAIVFDAGHIIEKSACSIHGTKMLNSSDPVDAVLYCAAAMNAGDSPISNIINQIVAQNEYEVPEAENTSISNEGIKTTVDGHAVLLGSKQLLKENGVMFPDVDFEEKYLSGDRKILYLAVDYQLTMLLTVSYYIRRTAATFFKALAKKEISIVIHSSDPNITPEFITKKCKLKSGYVLGVDNAESAYLNDKIDTVDTALEADVFTDGSIAAISKLFEDAQYITNSNSSMTFALSIMSLLCVLLVIVSIFIGNGPGNIFLLFIKLLSILAGIGVPHLVNYLSKRS